MQSDDTGAGRSTATQPGADAEAIRASAVAAAATDKQKMDYAREFDASIAALPTTPETDASHSLA